MSAVDSRSISLSRRLKFVLLILILWDGLALAAELSFGGPLYEIDNNQICGLLGGRAGFGGAMLVPMAMYAFALVRDPLRYPAILWLAVLEQGASALFAVFHLAAGDLMWEGAVLPIVGSLALVVVLLLHMPRPRSVI